MTNEQILEQQVEALEKLLQLRSAIIEDLESRIDNLNRELASRPTLTWPNITTTPYSNPPSPLTYGGGTITWPSPTLCPDGTPHQYPSMWGGTMPPACSKCGYQGLGTGITITSQQGSNTGQLVVPNATNSAPVHTSGYMQTLSTTNADNTNTNIFSLNSRVAK